MRTSNTRKTRDNTDGIKIFRGDLVRRIMTCRDWSETEIADRMETGQAQLNKVRHGKLNFTIGTLARLADALEVQAWELLHPCSQYVRLDDGWKIVQIYNTKK